MGIYRPISKKSMANINEIKGFNILEVNPAIVLPQMGAEQYAQYAQPVSNRYIVEFIVGSAKMKSDVFNSFDEVKIYLKKLLNVKI